MTIRLHSKCWRLETNARCHKVGRGALVALALAFTGALGCNSKDSTSMLSDIDATSFKIAVFSTEACDEVALRSESSVSPDMSELIAEIGTGSAEFMVLMTEEFDLQQYPLPTNRDVEPESDATYLARANIIADSQECALSSLRASGGEYLQSYVLINAFSANLTAEQAIQLGKRTDVRSVQLAAQSSQPLP